MTDTHRAWFVGIYPTPSSTRSAGPFLDIPLSEGYNGCHEAAQPFPFPQPYLIRPRIYLGPDLIVGPGKIELPKPCALPALFLPLPVRLV